MLVAGLLVSSFALATSADSGIRPELVRGVYLHERGGINRANATRIREYTKMRSTRFFGLYVLLHQSVHGPLACVEKAIRARCTDDYRPKAASGWRTQNSYRGAEISNHVFGTAIDLDPTENTCCGCVGKWASAPGCEGWTKESGPGPHEVPQCWVDAFEAHGFYWLGYDEQLRDTMHFEFLARPGTVRCE